MINLNVRMRVIRKTERKIFMRFALEYFRELNSRFAPSKEWKAHYFHRLTSNTSLSVKWILVNEKRVGFIIYGIVNHMFLPNKKIGRIYELYIRRRERRKNLAKICVSKAICDLNAEAVSQIESAEVPKDNVVQEFQRGYTLGGQILRPTKVVVSLGENETGNSE